MARQEAARDLDVSLRLASAVSLRARHVIMMKMIKVLCEEDSEEDKIVSVGREVIARASSKTTVLIRTLRPAFIEKDEENGVL